KELVRRVSKRLCKGSGTVEEILDAALEEIYESLKQGDSVSLRNFGTFMSEQEESVGCLSSILLNGYVKRLGGHQLISRTHDLK
ncbi:HU family DNA-binding protein, partial [Nostoc sp. NIES-2111]